MIALTLAWCGVAVLLALAVGRILAKPRRSAAVIERPSDAPLVRVHSATNILPSQRVAPAVDEIPAIQQMLSVLHRHDPRLAKTALLRWIGGISSSAIASALGVTRDIVEHDLQLAKLLLRSEADAAAESHRRATSN